MKRAFWGTLGLGAALVGACLTLTAQGQERASPAAGKSTRVAVINVQEALKSYQKFIAIRDQMKAKAEDHKRGIDAKAARLMELEKKFKAAKTPEEKEQIQKDARPLQIELEDAQKAAQKDMTALEQKNLAQIYKEVDVVVREYSKMNGIDLVFRYSEDWGEKYWSDESVVSRLAVPFWPMYVGDSVNITKPISDMLNQKYAAAPNAGAIKPASYQKGK